MRFDETGFAIGAKGEELQAVFEAEVSEAMDNLKAAFGQDSYHRDFYMRRVAFLNQWALDNKIYGEGREVVDSCEIPRRLGLI